MEIAGHVTAYHITIRVTRDFQALGGGVYFVFLFLKGGGQIT